MRGNIPRFAKKVREEYGSDAAAICEQLGITVVYLPLGGYRGYYKMVNEFPFIVISTRISELEQSYVLVHELAHFFLHKGWNRIFMDSMTYFLSDKLEAEADKFAAHYLWGEPPMFQEQYMDRWDIAECLNIPVCEVDGRMIDLEIYY